MPFPGAKQWQDHFFWWKWTIWFQFAHHPLCRRFQSDVFQIGRWRVCRSCALLWLSFLTSGLILLLTAPPLKLLYILGGSALPGILLLSYPRLYRQLPRSLRDLTRSATGAIEAMMLMMLLKQSWWISILFVLFSWITLRFYKYRRQVEHRNDCQGCPELGGNSICSGYAAQSESIRAYQLEMEKRLEEQGAVPLVVLQAQGKKKAI